MIIDNFDDIRRRVKRKPSIDNLIPPINCNCGHPENYKICDRWDCAVLAKGSSDDS